MKVPRATRQGFTLVEVLIALAILSILSWLLLAITRQYFDFTNTSKARAALLQEASDALGYIYTTLQEAQEVRTGGVTVNGVPYTASTGLVLFLPEDGDCSLRAWRVMSIDDYLNVYSAPYLRGNPSVRGTNVLVEYRKNGVPCTASSISGAQPGLVLEFVDPTTGPLFSYDATSKKVTVTVRFMAYVGHTDEQVYLPTKGGRFLLTVFPRNL